MIDLQARAEHIGLSMRDIVVRFGGVSYSTYHRWQQDDANPQLTKMTNALDQIEAEIERREKVLLQELSKRHGSESAAA